MKLSSILNPKFFFRGIPAGDRQSVYKSMLERAAHEIKQSIDPEKIASEIVKRENSFSMPYEKGAALPHFRSPEFEDLYIIIGIPDTPVLLKENDKAPSQIIIMSLVSEKTSDTYLKALSAFSRYIIKNNGAVSRFASCKNGDMLNELFDAENVALKKELTAEDIMRTDFQYIGSGSSVAEALDTFTKYAILQMPVLDSEKRLLGVIDSANILKKSIPAHYMILDNIKIISGFEPFQHILNNEDTITVNEYIREPRGVAELSTPLIQLVLMLVKDESLNIFIVDENKKLVGIVTMTEIVQRVLRG